MSHQLGDSPSQPTERPQRRYYLDWLRVFAVLLLFPFHAAAIFYNGELGEFYLQNDRTSLVMDGLVLFIHQWHMPLFFLLSGAATRLALSWRSPQQYVYERMQRLLIPFGFGILVLVPPLVYYHLLSNPNYPNSYLQFYPQFFNGIRPKGNFEWGHLWFVIYLFTFSLLALPFLLYLRQRGAHWQTKLAAFLEKPGAIFWLAVPFALIEAVLRPRWMGFQNLYDDWANVCLYLLYFICGYLMSADCRFAQAIARHLRAITILAAAGMLLWFGLWQTQSVPERGYSLSYMLYQAFRGTNTWFWVMTWLGLGQKYLNFNHPVLRYTSEAAYPFYLLHPPVLIAIGFYVVQWDAGIMPKFWLICTTSWLGTGVLYEVLIRRYNLPRLLFGLKPLSRPTTQPSASSSPDA